MPESKIVGVCGIRGGVGKTSVATSVALMAAREGKSVLLVDLDEEGSAMPWSQMRDAKGLTPAVTSVRTHGTEGIKQINTAFRGKFDLIVLDMFGARGDSKELLGAMAISDLVLIPTRPAGLAFHVLSTLDGHVGTASSVRPDLKAFMVLTFGTTHPNIDEAAGAEERCDKLENIHWGGVVMRNRKTFQRAMDNGSNIVETQPDSRGAEEVQELYQLVKENL